jgi:hypothetical protein
MMKLYQICLNMLHATFLSERKEKIGKQEKSK